LSKGTFQSLERAFYYDTCINFCQLDSFIDFYSNNLFKNNFFTNIERLNGKKEEKTSIANKNNEILSIKKNYQHIFITRQNTPKMKFKIKFVTDLHEKEIKFDKLDSLIDFYYSNDSFQANFFSRLYSSDSRLYEKPHDMIFLTEDISKWPLDPFQRYFPDFFII
jgi:hypothetical protein